MSLLAEFDEFIEKSIELNELCKKIALCDAEADGDFDLSEYLIVPDQIRENAFSSGKVTTPSKSVALREAHDSISSMDRLHTFTEMDRSFFWETYAPIEYEVARVNTLNFQKGTLAIMVPEDD